MAVVTLPREYNDAMKESNRKWDAASLDRISISVPKGGKNIIKAAADERGVSMNSFILQAIQDALNDTERRGT